MNYREYREKRIKAAGIHPVLWMLSPLYQVFDLEDTKTGWMARYTFNGQGGGRFWISSGSSLYRFILEDVIFPEDRGSKEVSEEDKE